eukprot:TRINITY_DN3641_c0_g1_i2.p1 TRINITY_DN3641_c0_g1~~TRINITY_DN3641_c0_g1_i2.p1  ORF type:complete len:327 (+),score=138.95 TRINITY_DN3641_c0_g1_i2:44-1024(+)
MFSSIVVREFGPSSVLKLEEIATPILESTQVLVNIKAAGVNPVDTYIRTGTYPRKPNLPYTPGNDGAGVIEAVGDDVKNVKVGERVYLSGSVTGTYASKAVCKESQVHPLPDNVSFEQGAAVWVPYATAYRSIVHRAKAKENELVLINGGSGAVGTGCIQLCKQFGMKIIATAGSDDGLNQVIEQGADKAINHKSDTFMEEIKEYCQSINKDGVDVIFEMLANVNLDTDLQLLDRNGRVVIIGNRGTVEINPRYTMGLETSIMGMSLGSSTAEDIQEYANAIQAGLSEGYLNPVVGESFPLEKANEAHDFIIERPNGAKGKITLCP